MTIRGTTSTLEQQFANVKYPINAQLPLFSDTVIHHKVLVDERLKIPIVYKGLIGKPYGVSSASKLLPVSLFIKKYEYIKSCLSHLVGLTDCEVEAVMRLLRIKAYYGIAYPKASQIAGEREQLLPQPFLPYPGYVPPKRHYWGTSRATFWRAIHRLKELGLITVINRYILREHAQISNLYRLDKLIILVAKYLAEHIAHVWPEWLEPYLHIPWPQWWSTLLGLPDGERPP